MGSRVLAFVVSKESKMSHLRFCNVVLRYTFIVGHCSKEGHWMGQVLTWKLDSSQFNTRCPCLHPQLIARPIVQLHQLHPTLPSHSITPPCTSNQTCSRNHEYFTVRGAAHDCFIEWPFLKFVTIDEAKFT